MNKRWVRFILVSLLIVVLSFGFSGSAFASGNSNQGSTPLEKARQVLEEKLIGLPGIAGIAHSEETGEIVVFLENERAKGQVPSRFEGFPVRMEITGKFQARSVGVADPISPTQVNTVSRLTEVRPLVGGISVSAYVAGQSWAGTLGMVTYDNKILSNAHVIALDLYNNFLPSRTPIIQQGSKDGGTLDDNKVGELEKYIEIKFGERKGKSPIIQYPTNYADAAIATIDSEVLSSAGVQFDDVSGNYQVSGTTTVNPGDHVRKSGRTTGVTEKAVYQTNASVIVDYGFGKQAYFEDQIMIMQPYSDRGDSGSMADNEGKFVGLVFAGSDDYSIICKASYIIEGLGIDVEEGGDNPPDVTITNPNDGATASAVVDITADASDDNGVTQVEFFVDGLSIGEDTDGSDGWSASWDTTAYTEGAHTVSATATDTIGQTDSDSVSVTVDNEPATGIEVTSISPDTMPAGTTIDVIITGSGFITDATVTFENGSGPAPIAIVTDVIDGTEIYATVTAKSGGPPRNRVWDVRVTNPDGSSDVLSGEFTVTP